ncbi:MAG: Fe-S cluster assembly ATPase SufC, partial [Thaumarchaeota archaeon]|nr:Fe-S cluster assembly ATPase SufC [Nitrososphaerota archaeon]
MNLGKVHVLMGPNGSGKSTLAHALMGDPRYKIKKGKILLNGKNITKLSPDQRARKGLFLSFQQPVEIDGIRIINFLHNAYNSLKSEQVFLLDFRAIIREKAKLLKIDEDYLGRYLNKGFSGGEKKKMEILQLLALDPKIAILDETDSGLDIDALKIVAKGINKFMNKDKTVLIITHYKRILNYIKPDKVHVLIGGKIVQEDQ